MENYKEVLSLINQKKIKEAEVLLREVKERDGKYYYLIGLVSFFKGNEEEAMNFFRKALEEGEVSEIAKKSLAYLFFSRGDYESAIELLEKVRDKTVNDYFVLFSSYLLLREYEKAQRNLEKAYSLDKKKTKELLLEFYHSYVKDSEVDKKEKELLLTIIQNLDTNN